MLYPCPAGVGLPACLLCCHWHPESYPISLTPASFVPPCPGLSRAHFPLHPLCLLADQARDFVQSCLNRDEKQRPTAEQLLEHPWLQVRASRARHWLGHGWLSSCGVGKGVASDITQFLASCSYTPSLPLPAACLSACPPVCLPTCSLAHLHHLDVCPPARQLVDSPACSPACRIACFAAG